MRRIIYNLTLEDTGAASRVNLLNPAAVKAVTLECGQTILFDLHLKTGLPPKSYTGELRFEVTSTAGEAKSTGASGDATSTATSAANAVPEVKSVPVNVKVRTSVVWVIATALLGIVIGWLARLVYDPKMVERLTLIDWMNDVETRIGSIEATADRDALFTRDAARKPRSQVGYCSR